MCVTYGLMEKKMTELFKKQFSEFSENEKVTLADLLHIIVEEIVKEVCND